MEIINKLFQILINNKGNVINACQDRWGDSSQTLFQITDEETVIPVPGNLELSYSFIVNRAPVPKGWIVIYVECEDISEAIHKAKSCWWNINVDTLFKKHQTRSSGKYRLFADDHVSILPPPLSPPKTVLPVKNRVVVPPPIPNRRTSIPPPPVSGVSSNLKRTLKGTG